MLLTDDARVVLHVRAAGNLVGELADVERSADNIELCLFLQLLRYREDVDRLV